MTGGIIQLHDVLGQIPAVGKPVAGRLNGQGAVGLRLCRIPQDVPQGIQGAAG